VPAFTSIASSVNDFAGYEISAVDLKITGLFPLTGGGGASYYVLTYDFTVEGSANATPEPGSLALLFGGALALLAGRLRKTSVWTPVRVEPGWRLRNPR
jgi:hypothetical protein